MSVEKGHEAREIISDKGTKIPEKEERLCDQVEGVILIKGGTLYPLIVKISIQRALKFEEGGLQKVDIFMFNHLLSSTKMCRRQVSNGP